MDIMVLLEEKIETLKNNISSHKNIQKRLSKHIQNIPEFFLYKNMKFQNFFCTQRIHCGRKIKYFNEIICQITSKITNFCNESFLSNIEKQNEERTKAEYRKNPWYRQNLAISPIARLPWASDTGRGDQAAWR